MKKVIYMFFVMSLFVFPKLSFAQGGCGCVNCPQLMPDNFMGDFYLDIVGATNDDLSDPTQGICGVNLNFDHQYIGDLAIILTSPGGQQITLVGPIDFFGESDFSTYDVSFVPCMVTPVPDAGNGVWNNINATIQNYDFTGSYHPNSGCLEDFNIGPINGTWTLTVIDGQAIDAGIFNDYEIIFCDDTGINCNTNECGVLAEVEGPSFACEGDTIIVDASGSTGNTFMWGTDNGVIIGPTNGQTIQVAVSGTYSVTVSDNGDCPEVGAVIFATVPEVPTAEITAIGVLDCNNDQVLLDGSTDITEDLFVNWIEGASVDENNFNPIGMDLELEITEPGTYTMVIINTESACSQTATIVIEDESILPIISLPVIDTISCTNTEVALTGASDINGSSYIWNGPNGLNSPTQNTNTDEPGDYTLIVTAPNGCIDSVMIEIASDTIPPDFSVNSSNTIDCIVDSASLEVTTTNELTTYNWSGPNSYTSQDESPVVNEGGNYTLLATDTNGCTAEQNVEVMQSADVPSINTVDNGTITCNNQEFALSGSSTSQVTYEWTGPNNFSSTDADVGMVTDTGTYILTVLAANGCSVSSPVFIDADTTQPILTLDPPALLGCSNTNTILTSSTSETGLTYAWSGPNGQTYNTVDPEIEGAGIYNLIITGENGCENNYSIEVITDDTPPDVDVSIDATAIITCDDPDVRVTNNITNLDYTYEWSGPNSFMSNDASPLIEEEGTYDVIVTGANGCTAVGMLLVNANTAEPDISFTTDEITCNNSTVSIGVNSADNIVEYAWTSTTGYTSTIQNPSDITQSGDYTVVITGDNGCTNTVTFEVTESQDIPDGQIISNEGIVLDCTLTSVELSATSTTMGATFSWEDASGNPVVTDQITADVIGTYTLITTGPNGCDVPQEIVITENIDGPVITSNPDVGLACNGDVPLSISSDENITSYEWSGPNSFTSSDANPEVGIDGTYNVIVTGNNGCTSTTVVEVLDQQVPPSIFVDPTQTLVCGQSQIAIGGGSNDTNVSYSWETPDGNIVSADNTASIDVNAQGTYVLTVTNTDSGCDETAEVIVDQDNNTPDAEIEAVLSTTINCNFSEITLNATDSDNGTGFEFIWGNTGGTNLTGESSLEPTVTEAGMYFITVTNTDNQCTSIASVTIDSDLVAPEIELSTIPELNCLTPTINIENTANNIANNLEYNWEIIQGGNITSASDLTAIDVDMPGNYALTITNPTNGCVSDITFNVEQDINNPVISAGDNLTLDCGVNSLLLDGSLTSGETDISIAWTSMTGIIIGGEDTFSPEVESAADYTLTVTNNVNGCTEESVVTVEPNLDLPVIVIQGTDDFNCATSSIVLDASNSTSGMGIEYVWTNDEGLEIFDNNTLNPEIFEAGTYTLTVLNTNNNCENTSGITIEADTLSPTLVLGTADELSCTVEEVNLAVNSDLTGLDLQWNALTGNIVSGSTTATPLVNQAGEYQLVVTSTDNECTTSLSLIVELDENTPAAAIALPDTITCATLEVVLDASNSTESTDISISWESQDGSFASGQDGLNPVVNSPGTYTLTLNDSSNGCEVSQSVVVPENVATPEVNIGNPDIINCLNGSITLQALNLGDSEYEYLWESLDGNIIAGATTLTPELDEGGSYELIITDIQNGCTTIADEVLVEKDIENPVIMINNSFDLTCPEPSATIDGTGTSTGSEFNYSWTDLNNTEINNALETTFTEAGDYTLEITNTENGCTEVASISVEDLRQLPDVFIPMPETITCLNPSIPLLPEDLNGQNLEYTWLDANGNMVNTSVNESILNVTLEGQYTLSVIDPSNECEATYTVDVMKDVVEPIVTITSSNAGEITCEDNIVTLTGDLNGLNENEVSFAWTTANGNFVDGETTLNPTVNIAGEYQLQVTNLSNGCSNVEFEAITQDDAIPLATLSEPEILNCDVLSTTISIPANTGNVEIVWTLNGVPIPNANTNELEIDTPGEYMVEITNLDNGCNSMDLVNILQDDEVPVIEVIDGFELQCNISEYQIQASVDGNANYQIIWDAGNGNITQGENTLAPLVNEAGLYTLEVLNTENGCISTDEVNITVNENVPTTLNFDAQNPLCIDDLGNIIITDIAGGVGPYTYSADGGASFTDNIEYEDLLPGSYQLAAIDANGCQVDQVVTINEAEPIAVDLQEEIEIIVGDSATLIPNLNNIDPNDILAIQWSPSIDLSCDDCLTPTTSSPFDILYTLEITLGSGCSAMDQIQLRVDRNLDVYIPNAFSPNNLDGFNDEFILFAKESVVTNINSFSIFDRWGNQLFLRENIQANDKSQGWNGEYRDEKMQAGVYIYYIDVEFRDGSREILKGNVTLMK